MAPTTNPRAIFSDIPKIGTYPEVDKTLTYDTSITLDPDTVALNGGFLVKLLFFSVDPYLREQMVDAGEDTFVPAFTLGEPIEGYGIGEVVRSESSEVSAGQHLYGLFKTQKYTILQTLAGHELSRIENPHNIPWSYFVGVAGMPGKTAYMAWKEYADAKKGEVVFVSGGAGPVGSFVIQLAKRDGLKVIASAGSEEKVDFLKSIGADVAFNYKTADTRQVLKEHGPIDVYWDNVGGEALDAALEAAAQFARFIECGMITAYNDGVGPPLKNIYQLVTKSIRMQGFIVFNLYSKYDAEFYSVVPQLVAKGELKYNEELYEGLEKVGEALVRTLKGTNRGKTVVRVI